MIKGIVTLDSSPVEGALVQAINRDTNEYIGNDTTNTDGEYEIDPDGADNVHVVVEYDE